MKRRQFIQRAGLFSTGSLFSLEGLKAFSQELPSPPKGHDLRAKDVNAYLKTMSPVSQPSVDRIVIGDPETVVSDIGTAWMPYWETCKEAVRDDVNTLIVHEPTFYTHWDLDERKNDYYGAPPAGKSAYLKAVQDKKRWILDNGLVIIRCHDVLDKLEGFGIPFAFGELLGFKKSNIIRSRAYYNVYRIDPRPAVEVAHEIARKLEGARQPGVAFYGNKDYLVSSIGLGTGCLCDPMNFMDLEPDLFVAIDDAIRTWTQTVYARDTGRPLVVINHGTSEEAGVRMMSEHLRRVFGDRKVIHYTQGCTYDWISA